MGPIKYFFAVMIPSNNAQICSSHDIEGVEYLKVCCVAEWGTCGGTGCKTRSEAVGLTADDCCTQRILDSGVYCDDSGAAPCIAGPAPTCSNGLTGVENAGMCCVAGCEMCGGAGCKERAEFLGLTFDGCCTQRIGDPGTYCDDSESAPCIIGSGHRHPVLLLPPLPPCSVPPTCSNGLVGVESDGICCVAGCETCGGARCKKWAEVLGLTADDCCTQRISDSGIYCDNSETAPCIINSCNPSLSITLEWSDTISTSTSTFNGNVVDLYVTEPGGTIVYYINPLGSFGFLDDGLDSGFTSPDSYIILGDLDPDGSVLGVYQAQVKLYDGSNETSWTLTARTFGDIVWVEEGDFTTSDASEIFSVSLTDYDSNCGGSFSTSSYY